MGVQTLLVSRSTREKTVEKSKRDEENPQMRSAGAKGGPELVRAAALDLGHLVGQHVKVAQLELQADLQAMGRGVLTMVALGVVLAIGYALAMAGLAALMGGHRAEGIPLVAIGLVHVVAACLGWVLAPGRRAGSHLMSTSTTAMTHSLEVLKDISTPSAESRHAR